MEGCIRSYECGDFSVIGEVKLGDVGISLEQAFTVVLPCDDTVELLPACVSIMPIVGESDRLT